IGLQIIRLTCEVRLDIEGFVEYFLDLYTPVLELVTYGLALAAVVFCKNAGIRSSSVLFVFWLLKMLCETVSFRSAVRNYSSDGADAIGYVYTIISYPFIVGQFLLNCWSDTTNDEDCDPKRREDRTCPQKASSSLNRL
ncbi:unnamed protein product, partial [Allacma fusca]